MIIINLNLVIIEAKLISNQDAVIGGLLFVKYTFLLIDKKIKFIAKTKDGSHVGRNSTINSQDLNYTAEIVDENSSVKLKAQIDPRRELEISFVLKESSDIVDFKLNIIDNTDSNYENVELIWGRDSFRNSKSIDYENRYTALSYGFENNKDSYLSVAGSTNKEIDNVNWISFREHFFSSILILSDESNQVEISSEDLSSNETLDKKFTKRFLANIPLKLDSYNQISFSMYFGPLTYKSYLSQIKMKILKPELEVINEKYKDDPMKKQQETMNLYTKSGANPMSGCLPAFLQMPIFFALFTFFPVAFSLRQKSFLWADDLSSYDSILDLGFYIPLYGDHISLFPILASVAIFFYTKMTTGQQMMSPSQTGGVNMKVIMYMMPLMMLFFFNNYASGLSLYYFISNLLTIVLMLIIKNFIIDDQKVLSEIEENKKKPLKVGGFRARLQKALEEAEKQKKSRGQ